MVTPKRPLATCLMAERCQSPFGSGANRFRVLAAFAGVRLAADAVHGDGQRLVGFVGDGAEAHRAGRETPHDRRLGLHRVELHRRPGRREVQHSAQRRLPGALLVGVPGESPVRVLGVGARGDLEVGDRGGVPHVSIAAAAPVEVAGVGQLAQRLVRPVRIADPVAALHLLGQHREADPLHPARGAREAALDELPSEADRLEDLGALVGLERGDPHLGEHLQDALGDALAVGGHHVGVGPDVLAVGEEPGLAGVPERLEREPGVDGVRAVADQQAVLVHLARLAGLDHEADAGAAVGAHEVVVHAAGGEQRADRHPLGSRGAVGEHEQAVPVVDGLRGLRFQARQRLAQPRLTGASRERDVQSPRPPAALVDTRQRRKLFVRQDGMGHAQPVRVLLGHLQQVRLGSDVALQRHDHFFANRVDGGVGDLREALLEVVVEHAGLVGEHRQRRVVAHRAQRIAALAHDVEEHELHGLGGVAERLHALEQRVLVEAGDLSRSRPVEVVQVEALAREPLAVGAPPGPVGLDLVVGHHSAGIEVDEEQPPRPQPALLDHAFGGDGEHPDLGRHDAAVVVGDVVAARAKPVAVQHRADAGAVGEHDGRRAVPRLHQAGVVLVERTLVGCHVGAVLPRLRDHHHDRRGERAPRHEQELEHVVEVARVGAVRLHHREELREIVAEELGAHHALARVHPVAVAEQGVDLAVVAHEAVRLRAVPGGEGVGAEARVHHREVGLVVGVLQIVEELEELMRGQHALVDDHLRRERAEVEQGALGETLVAAQGPARMLADDVELPLEGLALEGLAIAIRARRDEELLHVRHGGDGGAAEIGAPGVDRQRAPAEAHLALRRDDGLDALLARAPLGRVMREEHVAGTVEARLGEGAAERLAGDAGEQPVRQRGEDAGAIAGIGLVADAAAMVHAAVDVLRVVDDGAARAALDVAHEADAAALVLEAGVVEPLRRGQPRAPVKCPCCRVHRALLIVPVHRIPGG